MKNTNYILLSILLCLSASTSFASHLIVTKTDFDLSERLEEVARQFQENGSDAVSASILKDLNDPVKKAAWQNFVESSEVKVLAVECHPNEKQAVDFMNERFIRMGLGNLRLQAAFNPEKEDRTALPEDKIRGKKWLRYLAGPGVAMVATALSLPSAAEVQSSDYLLLILPGVGVGVTTVLLELQFAWPYLNNIFWKKVWTFGGPLMGRISNITVNFLYGMSLYGAGVGASHIPVLFGGEVIPFAHLPFAEAAAAAAIGGLTFHIAMGQFQTDIATEEARGHITGDTRYGLETKGVLVNNSARVLDWIVPVGFGVWAQSGFFMLKTLPQLIKTNFIAAYMDEKIRRELNPDVVVSESVYQKVKYRCSEFLLSIGRRSN
jgi:hypothetical protein